MSPNNGKSTSGFGSAKTFEDEELLRPIEQSGARFRVTVTLLFITLLGGWVLYGGKRILSNTDLKFTLFFGEPLEDDITIDGELYEPALENSDRIRLQTDVIVKF